MCEYDKLVLVVEAWTWFQVPHGVGAKVRDDVSTLGQVAGVIVSC